MKRINLSLLAIFTMGTFAFAGGDIAPVEPVVSEPVVLESNSNFYVGLAYSYQNLETDGTATPPGTGTIRKRSVIDDKFSAIMLQAGYNFNQYIAIEGRYWFGLSSSVHYSNVYLPLKDRDTSIDAWGIYIKPQYPITEDFSVYALLGYGGGDIDIDNVPTNVGLQYADDKIDGFSWGLGVSYSMTDNISLFVDYINIYNDDDDYYNPSTGYKYNLDRNLDKWNFGLTYNF